ncbi:WXG100 family type VII secretion target [Kitasatospora phosalacinea]|uniref:WXG100 family type VII secretion target n=1 Tax=Kitasatospora phosalacinea TaxID=2065 RepID=UPI001FD7BAEC|nr:PPE domain-containing protein [Kitasatospora phosalacinea]
MLDQGGGSGGTDFSAHSHDEMVSMVNSMDSGSIMAAADPWRRAHETLTRIQASLTTATGDATSTWQGGTSDAFHSHMTTLAKNVSVLAAYADNTATALQLMSAAVDQAKADMPEVPGFWDKVGDGVSDAAKGSVGIDDADTRQSISESRKEEAVGVMQLLAAKYTVAAGQLKSPGGIIDDQKKELTPPDNGGSAALIAAIASVGASIPQSSGRVSGSSGSQTSLKSSSSRTPQAPKVQPTVVRPTDAGISGGTANALPQPKGPGTGIDGIQGGVQGGVRGGTTTLGGPGGVQSPVGGGGGGLSGGGTTGGLIGHGGGTLAGGTGLGGSRAGFSGNSVSKSGTFGAGGLGGSGAGAGGAAGGAGAGGRAGGVGAGGLGGGAGAGGASGGGLKGRSGGGLTGKAGGVVGETAQGGVGGRAFSQGGSGIGRSRFGQQGAAGAAGGHAGGAGQAGAAGQGAGMAGHGQGSKRAKKGTSDRPDYLVEDEETWASGEKANPNVVE